MTALEKARGAIEAAAELVNGHREQLTVEQVNEYHDLLTVASVQARIAQAEALERLADFLEGRFG